MLKRHHHDSKQLFPFSPPACTNLVRSHLINMKLADFENFWPDTRRDEGAYPQRSVTEEQRRSRSKGPKVAALYL
jgi:hypothetical protein